MLKRAIAICWGIDESQSASRARFMLQDLFNYEAAYVCNYILYKIRIGIEIGLAQMVDNLKVIVGGGGEINAIP